MGVQGLSVLDVWWIRLNPIPPVVLCSTRILVQMLPESIRFRSVDHCDLSVERLMKQCVPPCMACNCFVRWVLILSRTSSRIDPISDARCTGRQHSKKHSQNTVYYLTKSGICMPTFHVAQIYIHRNSSRHSVVRPMLKNLVMPLPNLR